MGKARARKKEVTRTKARNEPAVPSTESEIVSQSRALFIIIASTVLVYANSLSGAFVFDDTKQIVGNPYLHSWGNVLRAFTSDVWSFQRGTLTADIPPPYYRPLFTAYLTLNYQLFGLWEPGWHLMNLLVHIIATVMVYFLIRRLSGDQIVALLAALLFGLHPAHVESVSWISGIPDPLAALFYVPSLYWYVRYREEGQPTWLAASVAAFGMAALCKETPLALPIVFVVWELARAQNKEGLVSRLKATIPRLVPYAVVATAYLAIRFSVLGRISWKHPFMARVPDSAIWMSVPYVFVSYLRHLLAPFYLSLIYGTSFISSATELRFIVPVLLLLALALFVWVYRKKLTADIWVALALIVVPLLPVLNLKVFHYEYIIQDRYLYLPSIGFSYLVAVLIVRLARRQKTLAMGIAAVVLISFGASTILQNRVWHDAIALWQRAVKYSPNSWSTHYNLGLAYLGNKQHDLAQTELLEAKRLNPNQATVYNNLALAQAQLGDNANAISNLKSALTLDPNLLEAHNNLGAFLYQQGDYAAAKREFDLLLQRDPSSISARFNLARTLAASGEYAAAIREFEVVLANDPRDVAARYELGLSLAAVNRKQDAVAQLTRALQLDADPDRATEMRKKLEQIQSQP